MFVVTSFGQIFYQFLGCDLRNRVFLVNGCHAANAILKTSGTLIMKNNGASVSGVYIIKFDGKLAKRRPGQGTGKGS